jgi:hypothetical protein
MSKRRVIALVVLICISADPSRADDTATGTDKNWSFSVYIGGTSGGPASDLEVAMTASAFDARSPGGFLSSGRDHPFSHDSGEVSFMIGATRALRYPFSISAMYGHSGLEFTSGYHQQATYLHVTSSVDVFAMVASVSDRSMLKSFLQEDLFEVVAGLGPAVYLTKAERTSSGGPSETNESTTVGFLFNVGLRTPASTMFFVEGNAQYRYVGSVEVGPFTATSTFTGDTAQLPSTDVSFSHWFFGLAIGVRL